MNLRKSPLLGRNDPALDRELRNTAKAVNALLDAVRINGTAVSVESQPGGAMAVTSADVSTGNAGNVEITAGDSGAGTGGAVNVYAGSGQSGGQFFFTAGSGVATGGDFNVVAGDASDSGGAGGSLFLNAGNATAGGGSSGGNLYLTSGAGESTGGSISLFSALAPTATVEVTDDGSNSLLGFHGATPVAQPTTSTAAATFVANSGTAINSASTFDGYTIAKVVRALRNMGLLA